MTPSNFRLFSSLNLKIQGMVLFFSLSLSLSSWGIELKEIVKDWESVNSEDAEIFVKKKSFAGTKFLGVSGITTINASIPQILSLIFNPDNKTKWVDRLKKTVVVEDLGPFDKVLHELYSMPWPISDRDSIYRTQVRQNQEHLVVIDLVNQKTHPQVVESDDYERITIIFSQWVLKAIDADHTQVLVMVNANPGGSLPSWLVNMLQKSWPRNTLSLLKKLLDEQPRADYPLPAPTQFSILPKDLGAEIKAEDAKNSQQVKGAKDP
jgi:hypothetical protein